jgi:hypothetical protein
MSICNSLASIQKLRQSSQYLEISTFNTSPVYTTVILGTARLNFGTRTHAFWSACCVYTTKCLLKYKYGVV